MRRDIGEIVTSRVGVLNRCNYSRLNEAGIEKSLLDLNLL